MVYGRYAVVFSRSWVKQTKSLYSHGVNAVGDRFVKIRWQIIRDVETTARQIRCSCTADEGSNNQQEEHDNALSFRMLTHSWNRHRVCLGTASKPRLSSCRMPGNNMGVQNCCVMITMWTASSTVYNPVIEVYVALHCNVMAYRVSSMTMQGTSDYIARVAGVGKGRGRE